MKKGTYKSRKEQCEGFAEEVTAGRMSLAEALQSACFVGAAEERSRIFNLLILRLPPK